MAEYLQLATLTEWESKIVCEECTIPTLYNDFCSLAMATQKSCTLVADDIGTQTLLSDLLLEYDKISWFLESCMQTESNMPAEWVGVLTIEAKAK